MSVKVIDNTAKMKGRIARTVSYALGDMATDIEAKAKRTVPVKNGDLQDEIRPKVITKNHHRVVVDKEYASYQERGRRRDGTHTVRRYSTPGTGKNFLKNAGDSVSMKVPTYIAKAFRAVRIF